MRLSRERLDALQFACLIAVALALIPGGAHLLELPNKIAMPADEYMTVQNIYRGWALTGIVIFAALLLAAVHSVAVRANRAALTFSAIAVLCVVASLAIFFMFTYPMNVASSNWTVTPPDFEAARRQWEFAHAAAALMILAAFGAMTLSVLVSRRPEMG